MIQTYNLAGQYLLHIYHASRYLEQNNIKCTDVYQPYSIRRIHLTALVSIIFNCMQITFIPTSNMDSQISDLDLVWIIGHSHIYVCMPLIAKHLH